MLYGSRDLNAAKQPARRAITRERFRLLTTIEREIEAPLAILGIVWLALIVAALVWRANTALATCTLIVWTIFVADFVVRAIIAPNKGRFLKRNVLLLLSLAVPALGFLRIASVFAAMPAWELALLRLLTALNTGIRGVSATFKRRGFVYAVALVAAVTFAAAAGIDNIEQGVFRNYGYSLWWTAMVMTTMGPDRYPQTAAGRVLMWAVAVFAFSIFGYVTASIASYFVNSDAANPNSGVAGEASIEAVLDEVRALRRELAERGISPETQS